MYMWGCPDCLYKESMAKQPSPMPQLAKRLIHIIDRHEYSNISNDLFEKGTYTRVGGTDHSQDYFATDAGSHWYRSKEQFTPFEPPFVGGGYMSNKMWPLNEVCILVCCKQ